MSFELEISNDGTFVTFRPKAMGQSLEDFVERIGALGDFADKHGTSRILFDFRAGLAPLDAGLYEAALASPYLKLKGKWRVALVTSVVAPNYNVLMVEGTSDFLNGLGQVAKPFLDYDEAIEWLVGG